MSTKPKKVIKSRTPAQSEQDTRSLRPIPNDTKKLGIHLHKRKSLGEQRKQAPIFQFKHIQNVIKEIRREGYYTCILCTMSEFTFKCIRKHVLSKKHKENAKDDADFPEFRSKCEKNFNDDDEEWKSDNEGEEEEEEKSESQLKEQRDEKRSYQSKIDVGRNNENTETRETKKEKEGFLSYLHICCALGLSIRQISILSKELKKLEVQSKLGFLLKNNFSEQNISKIINCFGRYYKEQITNELSDTKYSLMIDNSTISKTQICAIKARYIKNKTSLNNPIPQPSLENKIIGIKYLGDNSTAQTLLEALQEKVFDLGLEVKENFTSITFDNAKSMIGNKNGLIALIKKEFLPKFIFGLGDPCHLLNLAVKHTVKDMPDDISDFIDTLHHHFVSPQRTAALYKTQRELGLKKLGLCHYVSTRWLSMGNSVERMLEIWDSLIKYLETKPKSSGLKKFDHNKYKTLLEDKSFKLKIVFLSSVLKTINQTNIAYQSQNLEIQELYRLMKNCVEMMLDIILVQEKIPQDFNDLNLIPWKDDSIKEYILDDNEFIKRMGRELHNDLLFIETITDQSKKTEVINFCKSFLLKLIHGLVIYLPLGNKEIKLFDFVKLEKKEEVKQKTLEFNKVFQLNHDELLIVKEINNLFGEEFFRSRSSLETWAWIESQYNQKTLKHKPEFPVLSEIFKLAHVLPVSSAGVEQSFSTLKMLKTSLRSQLKESTVESLMLIQQDYDPMKSFEISPRLLEIYTETRKQYEKIKIQFESKGSDFFNDIEEEKSLNPKIPKHDRPIDSLHSEIKKQKKTSEDFAEKDHQDEFPSDEEDKKSGEMCFEDI